MIEEVKGNILDTDCKIIAHGVNCQNKMGSGVAKVLYTKWPKVKEAYHDYFVLYQDLDTSKYLGKISAAPIVEADRVILNCFTQQNYGYDAGQQYLNYEALSKCMHKVLIYCMNHNQMQVAIPKIGCGLAGGNWNTVKDIINERFPRNFKVKVYYL